MGGLQTGRTSTLRASWLLAPPWAWRAHLAAVGSSVDGRRGCVPMCGTMVPWYSPLIPSRWMCPGVHRWGPVPLTPRNFLLGSSSPRPQGCSSSQLPADWGWHELMEHPAVGHCAVPKSYSRGAACWGHGRKMGMEHCAWHSAQEEALPGVGTEHRAQRSTAGEDQHPPTPCTAQPNFPWTNRERTAATRCKRPPSCWHTACAAEDRNLYSAWVNPKWQVRWWLLCRWAPNGWASCASSERPWFLGATVMGRGRATNKPL